MKELKNSVIQSLFLQKYTYNIHINKYKLCMFSREEMEETNSLSSSNCTAYMYLGNATRISTLQIVLQLLGTAKNLAHLITFFQVG